MSEAAAHLWVPPTPGEDEDAPQPLDLDAGPWVLRVSDLKQWAYCPRIVYFTYTLPVPRSTPYKVEAGREAHTSLVARWQRRGLPRGLPRGEVQWEVPLWAPELGLSGKVDVLITTERGLVVVDIKHARRAFPGWKVQVAAYAWLVEHVFQRPVVQAFLYLSRARRAQAVSLTPRLRGKAQALVTTIMRAVRSGAMPPPAAQRGRCVSCEFRRFCNDIF